MIPCSPLLHGTVYWGSEYSKWAAVGLGTGNTRLYAFTPGEPVDVFLDGVNTPPLTTTVADPGGVVSTGVRLPRAPGGVHTLAAQGRASAALAFATVQVTPSLLLFPASATPGARTVV